MDLTQNDPRGSCVEGLAPNSGNSIERFLRIQEGGTWLEKVGHKGRPFGGCTWLVPSSVSASCIPCGKKLSDYLINVLPSSIRDKQTLTKPSHAVS